MAGRARDQRDHGGRGPAAAPVPRCPRRRSHRRHRALDPVQAAPGRHLGQLLRRPRRPVHHRRGLRGAAAGRRPGGRAAHGRRPVLDPGPRRRGSHPGVHPALAGPVRPVVVGRPARHPARADLPAVLVPAQHLRLGLLGPADHRRAGRRPVVPAVPAAAVHHRRAEDRRPARPRPRPAPLLRRPACLLGGTTPPDPPAPGGKPFPPDPLGPPGTGGSPPPRPPGTPGPTCSPPWTRPFTFTGQ